MKKDRTPPEAAIEDKTAPADDETTWETPQDRLNLAAVEAIERLLSTDPYLQKIAEEIDEEFESLDALRGLQKAPSVRKRAEAQTRKDLFDDVKGWRTIGGKVINEFSDETRERILKQCYHLYYRDPLARNIVTVLTFLVVGQGMRIKFYNDESGEALEKWERLSKRFDWENRYRKIITKTILLGEDFLLRGPLMKDSAWRTKKSPLGGAPVKVPDREALLKKLAKIDEEDLFLNAVLPTEIRKVEPTAFNREIPYRYVVSYDKTNLPEGWPDEFYADDITHFHINDLDIDYRGRSVLEPVLKYLAYYRLHLLDRMNMRAIQTRIPLIRKVPGGSKAVRGAKNAMTTNSLPRPGSIFCVGEKEIWERPTGPTDGASAEADGRALRLMIAAGVSLPEHLVTGDASNNNLASILSTTSPLGVRISDLRGRFAEQFGNLIEECVGAEVAVDFPEMPSNQILELMQAWVLLYQNKLAARSTVQAKLGLDPEEEDAKMEEEDEMYDNGHDHGDGEEATEDPDIPAERPQLDDQTDEEEAQERELPQRLQALLAEHRKRQS